MCTQVCMKIGPKNVNEDQRLASEFACSEILEKIGAGKNVLETDRLQWKLAFQYDPNKVAVHLVENSCSSKTTKLDCEPRILQFIVTIQGLQDRPDVWNYGWHQDSTLVHKPIFACQFSA